jgi:hypothetical protein
METPLSALTHSFFAPSCASTAHAPAAVRVEVTDAAVTTVDKSAVKLSPELGVRVEVTDAVAAAMSVGESVDLGPELPAPARLTPSLSAFGPRWYRFNLDSIDVRRLVTSSLVPVSVLLATRLVSLVLLSAWFVSSVISAVWSERNPTESAPKSWNRPAWTYIFYFTNLNLISLWAFFLVSGHPFHLYELDEHQDE